MAFLWTGSQIPVYLFGLYREYSMLIQYGTELH